MAELGLTDLTVSVMDFLQDLELDIYLNHK